MKIGPITMTARHDLDDPREWYEAMWNRWLTYQDFHGVQENGLIEYLNDLDNFKAIHLKERLDWLKENDIHNFTYHYVAFPHIGETSSFFRLYFFFYKEESANFFKSKWDVE